jgi:hypothetical protein
MHRITYEVSQRSYTMPVEEGKRNEEVEWTVQTQVVSGEPQVIAGTLRALADKLDSPGKTYR